MLNLSTINGTGCFDVTVCETVARRVAGCGRLHRTSANWMRLEKRLRRRDRLADLDGGISASQMASVVPSYPSVRPPVQPDVVTRCQVANCDLFTAAATEPPARAWASLVIGTAVSA
ncbi:hypothetical protein Mal4_15160 [Maioricimonas rarisocia]|uniref:Uncharacterized protein n=1 Tax=Maioricimonas rarisocia TaxID=2528026 RepID=A0A517Z455_9PLAN|nr:hypothetical protein Mal4_15160 [Maioricimonas rarisocia]